MTRRSILNRGRLILAFVALLVFFGATAIIGLLVQQRTQTIENSMNEARHDVRFIAGIVKQAYLNKDYAGIETVLGSWLSFSVDTTKVKVVASNGFELASVIKDIDTLYSQDIQHIIMDSDNKPILTITATRDFTSVYSQYSRLQTQIITIVLLFSAALGSTIWYTFRRLAVVPLETEIEKRIQAETELKRSHDLLDMRVQERTEELEQKNAHLEAVLEQQEQAKAKMKKLSTAVEQTDDVVVITSNQGLIEYVNPAFERTTGYSADLVLGNKPNIIKSGMHDESFYRHMWETIESGETFSDIFVNRKKDGSIYYEQKTITPIKDDEGNIINYLATGKDITERIKDQERLQFMATHDALTSLPNRVMLKDRLNHAIASSGRHKSKLAVMFLDLDKFKNINDSLGHTTGDNLLKLVTSRLTMCVRRGDTIARLGGDEFTILMEDIVHIDSVSQIAQKINAALSQPYNVDGYEIFTSASIGITIFPDDGSDVDNLLKNADTAMYRAKTAGGNSYQYYTHDMTQHAVRRLELQNQLLHALERNEFVLHYQPRISLSTGQVSGIEALLRWNSSQFGLVMPDDFIPVLEESNLIVDVGNWVMQETCQFHKQLDSLINQPVRISVNLSARQFREQSTLVCIGDMMKSDPELPQKLEIEITETMLMENLEMATKIMEKIQKMGILISVDDFGTGYSSLSYLKRFPIHSLKIDQSFVRDTPNDPDDVAIVQAVIALGHSLNLTVIAEGVENQEQVELLAKSGCDEIQGYVLSRALPPKELLGWLAQHNSAAITKDLKLRESRI